MGNQTVFIKRYPSKEEFPEYGQRVIGLVLEQNDLGLSKFLWNLSYNDDTKTFKMDGGVNVNIEYWLKEIELPSDDEILEAVLMKQDKDQTQFIIGGNQSAQEEKFYTKDEVIEILNKYHTKFIAAGFASTPFQDWIKDNL